MHGKAPAVLIIDDEGAMRHMLRLLLEKEGFVIQEAAHGLEGLDALAERSFDAVLCDIRMPEMDGIDFLKEVVRRGVGATVIMMSAYGTLDTAIECMKLGAYDYISKPFKKDEVVLTLRKAEERLRLQQENRVLREKLLARDARPLIFRSPAMEGIRRRILQAAGVNAPVLVTGETGTGKELVARMLHAQSDRRERPFVAVNCGAIPPGLFESELFGHLRGAFTGADRDRQGMFEVADGGVLFLDEIGELPLDLQPKLLRVLEEKEYRRVGESRPRRSDVRVIAATARNLKEEVPKGRFRDDLYYRLAVVEIHVPPLRERREDIPLLTHHFLARICAREGRTVPVVTEEALAVLMDYPWPGNVRELENYMEKTLIFCRGERIDLSSLPWETRRRQRDAPSLSLPSATARLEQEFIRKALAATGGNRTQAARLLEISLRGLLYKMKEYEIE